MSRAFFGLKPIKDEIRTARYARLRVALLAMNAYLYGLLMIISVVACRYGQRAQDGYEQFRTFRWFLNISDRLEVIAVYAPIFSQTPLLILILGATDLFHRKTPRRLMAASDFASSVLMYIFAMALLFSTHSDIRMIFSRAGKSVSEPNELILAALALNRVTITVGVAFALGCNCVLLFRNMVGAGWKPRARRGEGDVKVGEEEKERAAWYRKGIRERRDEAEWRKKENNMA